MEQSVVIMAMLINTASRVALRHRAEVRSDTYATCFTVSSVVLSLSWINVPREYIHDIPERNVHSAYTITSLLKVDI